MYLLIIIENDVLKNNLVNFISDGCDLTLILIVPYIHYN